MNSAKVSELLAIMTKGRVIRAQVGKLSLELHPSAFDSLQDKIEPMPNEDKCKCGHSINTAHNDLGCLLGCPADACAEPVPEGAHPEAE